MTFVKGQSGNPKGRAKGIPTKVTASIKQAFKDAFEQRGGVPALLTWADKDPTAFYNIVAKLIPTEITGKDGDPLFTMDERERELKALLATWEARAKRSGP